MAEAKRDAVITAVKGCRFQLGHSLLFAAAAKKQHLKIKRLGRW